MSWETYYGTLLVEAGKKRDGSPRQTLCTLILVAHSKTDVAALSKAHPHFKFRECRRGGRRSKP